MTKKKLLLDVDEVICFSGFLPLINEFLDSNYKIDDFHDYYLDEAVIPKERMTEFNQFISGRNLYEVAELLPKAVETIKDLNEVYEIYICSSCVNPFDEENSGRIFTDKYNFLLENFPFLKPERFIFTSVKYLFKADIQIDDRLNNLDSEIETRILFPSYHNRDINEDELKNIGVIRAGHSWKNGWDEIRKILLDN